MYGSNCSFVKEKGSFDESLALKEGMTASARFKKVQYPLKNYITSSGLLTKSLRQSERMTTSTFSNTSKTEVSVKYFMYKRCMCCKCSSKINTVPIEGWMVTTTFVK